MLIVCQTNPRGRKACAARKWFADNGPPDLQPLPLGYYERERLKHGGADHILAWFACSLDIRKYNVLEHPSFDDYARGVMASEFAPAFIKEDEELKKRFPPRHLDGLGPGLVWLPPKNIRGSDGDLPTLSVATRGIRGSGCKPSPASIFGSHRSFI
jgi:hypothetical protein